MSKIITTEIWYSRIVQKNKDRYDHSKAVYTRGRDKVEIICPEHGSFFQQADLHASGSGCPICADALGGNTQRTTQHDFIFRSEAIGDDIDHSEVVYKRATEKVNLICKKDGHGMFSMLPGNRLKGQTCPKCAQETRGLKQTKTQEQFDSECAQLPARGLTYKKAVYKGDKVKVIVTCKEHGDFTMWPSNILQGQGCPKCAKYGYNVNKPGYLYILNKDEITKVGITNRTPTHRVKEVTRDGGPTFEVLAHYYFADGNLALQLEGNVRKLLGQNYSLVSEVFTGSTECFLNVDLAALLNYVTPLATIESE